MKALIKELSLGSSKVEGEVSAWAIGIWENLKQVHPKVLLFIALVAGGFLAYGQVHFGVSLSALFTNMYFLLGSLAFAGALLLLILEMMSPRHNVNVLDTSH